MVNQLDIFGTFELLKPGYFNSTHLSGPVLTEAKLRSGIQDERVLAIFRRLQRPLTPLAVHREYEKEFGKTRDTSIRRSMTVLTSRGLLQKTDVKVMECYGSVNYQWKLCEY